MSISFIDGPAEGVILALRRAPQYLRVVYNPRATSKESKWDALDQIDDEPKPHEIVHVYKRIGEVFRFHIKATTRGASGNYSAAKYTFEPVQVGSAVLRSKKLWQEWVLAMLDHEKQRAEELRKSIVPTPVEEEAEHARIDAPEHRHDSQ